MIPFFSNTPDNTHCYQAALRIVLKYFLPEKDYSFEQLDLLTDKVQDKWTWPQAGILSLINIGFDVVILDDFNYKEFANNGVEYIRLNYGEVVANAQEENTDINQAVEYTKKLIKEDIEFINTPELNDISNLLKKGYLVICNVNQDILNNREGYTGHFVVVYGIDNSSVYFHDPGLPAFESRAETKKKFEKAWAISRDAYAFKLLSNYT